MVNIRLGAFFLVTAAAFSGLYFLERRKEVNLGLHDYTSDIEAFRKQAEDRLRAPDGWLSVVGLTWLKEGENKIGSAQDNQIILPPSAPANLGRIFISAGSSPTEIEFVNPKGVFVAEQPAQSGVRYELLDDKSGKPTSVKVGSLTFFIISRKNGRGVRIKDSESEARKTFKGRQWYPPKKNFVVEADWVAHATPQKILMPDVLGNLNEELSPGFIRFTFEGEMIELHPTEENKRLFFVFRDQTSGKETYGAARFLYANPAVNGKVVLDFNKAVNPPCAFTSFATCPMPPPENIVKIAVRAGELKPN